MDVSYCTPRTDMRSAESHVCDVPRARLASCGRQNIALASTRSEGAILRMIALLPAARGC